MPLSIKERARGFYERHEPACTTAFFAGGFLFDALFAGRIDRLPSILQQGAYLSLCAWLIGLELRERYGDFSPPPRLEAAWRYHRGATHFMLGTLLNIYTLFYFKSASLTTSLAFMAIMTGLLAVNELRPFEGSGAAMRMTLFSLCLLSYFVYLVPTLVGTIGPWEFLGSLACAGVVAAGLARWLLRRLPDRPHAIFRQLVLPFSGVALLFAGLYFAKLIPPVPLSLERIGIYHDVRWEGDKLALTQTRSRWRFWERGDQTFRARPGDKIYCFASVFSPTDFRDRLQVRWSYDDPRRGWRQSDAIPLDIRGGRGEGWRGFTAKAHYRPGRWRVSVETSDGRELGRIGLDVVPDDSSGPRAARTILR
ncbi:MAG: DUF2914 domain-containing protein [Elusimicrobia bacterium]|nr:DUF2914 domain-containing protein [Elusimicrobiota bacterium]